MEPEVLINWIETGLIKNIKQIGVEFHDVVHNTDKYFKLMKLLNENGFKVIAFEPNLTWDPTWRKIEGKNVGTDFFEIVFRRVDDSIFNC